MRLPIVSLLSVGMLNLLSACADTPPTAAVTAVPPAEVLYEFIVSPHGVTMAQHAMLPLTFIARNIFGDTIPGIDPATVQYIPEDSTLVTVNGGMLTAHNMTPVDSFSGPVPRSVPTRVIASLTHFGVTKADTFYVAVTPTVQPVVALSIQPAPYPQDSAWLGGFSEVDKPVPITMLTAHHDTVAGMYAYVSTSQRREHLQEYVDPRTALLSFRTAPPEKHVWVYAETNAYGVTLHDSVEYIATDLVQRVLLLVPDAQQRPQIHSGILTVPDDYEFWIAPCALMGFFNQTVDSVSIRFKDPTITEGCPTAGETGNIAVLAPGSVGIRYIRPVGVHLLKITRPNGADFVPALTSVIRVRSHTEL